MKIIELKPGVPGVPAIYEHKVPGEVYVPGVPEVPKQPAQIIVSMTQDEANLIFALVGNLTSQDLLPADTGSGIWQALRHVVRNQRFVCEGTARGISARTAKPC